MSEEKISLQEIHKNYANFIDSCDRYNFFTRSLEKQKEKIEECSSHIDLIKFYKAQAIKCNSEFEANHLFHMQCMINAMKSSLRMWVQVKENNFAEAWNFLIDAKEYIEIALKITDYEGVRNLESKLKAVEDSVFPNWALFNSPGFTETIGKCSICRSNFALCDHLENHVYVGRLCQRVEREIIEVDHVALVENPRDKRCIIRRLTNSDGKTVDYFTWDECEEKPLSDPTGNNNMLMESTVMSFRPLDLS